MPNEKNQKIDPLAELTADIVASYVSNNRVPISQVPKLIADVYRSFEGKPAKASATGAGKPGRPAKKKPGRPPKAGKPGRPPKKKPGRPPKAGKPGRPPKAGKPGRPAKAAKTAKAVQAVSGLTAKKSIHKDYLICFEDGREFKSLKRHLKSKYNLTPEQYRAKWNLPDDYPMVAPSYAKRRSELAKNMGLGKKRGAKAKPMTSWLSKTR